MVKRMKKNKKQQKGFLQITFKQEAYQLINDCKLSVARLEKEKTKKDEK